MTEITHSKARSLLQAAADQDLAPADRSALDMHLNDCQDCLAYANRLNVLEAELKLAFQSRWDNYRPNLNLQAIKHPAQGKLLLNSLFSQTNALSKVTMIAALLLGYALIVNLVGVRVPITHDETPMVLPTPNGAMANSATSPTPSIQTAMTGYTAQACDIIKYVIQENDTLESIAAKYGITTKEIQENNFGDRNLAAGTVIAGAELAIPICENTPSRTANVPGRTLTLTPLYSTLIPDQPQ